MFYEESVLGIALCRIFTVLLSLWNSEQKNGLIIKLFCFSSDFDETWWNCRTHGYLKLHQVSSKSDDKQKSFIDSLFFCSEFQSIGRIVKIIHSGIEVAFSYKRVCSFKKGGKYIMVRLSSVCFSFSKVCWQV